MTKKSFTLIELLVVIAIIGLLSTVVMVSVGGVQKNTRDAKRIADLKEIEKALNIFYVNYGRYPITAGHRYWDGHWMNFQNCLETGSGCGFSISNYESPMPNVPQDPLDSDPNSANNGTTYYPPWNACNNQMFVLRVRLEKSNNEALSYDADGNFYRSGDNGCNDPYYCIKHDWCR